MTEQVVVGLGSNLNREQNIIEAVRRLRQVFGSLRCSPVYDSKSVGFEGHNFLNLVALFGTSLTVREVVSELRAIEDEMGRDRSKPRFSDRVIDLDILLYGDLVLNEPGIQVPRDEILHNSFVLRPIQDLIPELIHPQAGESYASLWQRMASTADTLRQVTLDLD